MTEQPDSFETMIPDRINWLPWSKFHWLIVLALSNVFRSQPLL